MAPDMIDDAHVARLWPVPAATDDKYSRGVLGVIAGSESFPGAAILACAGAVRAGVGLVRYVGVSRLRDMVIARRPEVVGDDVQDELPRASAWVVGPGVADDSREARACEIAWQSGSPTVIDAGMVKEFAAQFSGGVPGLVRGDRLVFTPHAGELAQALSAWGHHTSRADVEASRLASAERFSDETAATVVLKGARTLVASPGHTTVELPEATPWLATAGSGDVLAGVIGSLLAAGLGPHDAAVCGAYVHARAAADASGAAAGGPIAAHDVAEALPGAIGILLGSTL